MAELVAVIASTHHPFYYRASTAPEDQAPPFAAEWVRKVEAFRETLTRAAPDILVMVGSDHFHQLWLDNMPQFLVGNAELRRQLAQRGARVRPAADAYAGRPRPVGHMLRKVWTPGSTSRSATSCASTTA